MLGRPPFYTTELTTSGDVAYIGGNWERDVAFAGYSVPLQVRAVMAVYMQLHELCCMFDTASDHSPLLCRREGSVLERC